ncbi:GntR family transcriptional regulator [Blastomonas sp.]|uniref:FadR/GntR family transcriptional regulator n=1 Tax=Blastomonas sp. TaxID=1909299 RepID=UPI00262BE605|nr:GntR family transcriptional regulator [Blastomonas sp.]MDM7957649.1 GntR family transcriptional regulator [Blastomonas sp.]
METYATTLIGKTAQTLSQLSLAAAPGDYLGAESDLLDRLGVSRPTLRQAAKIVERDRLISVRRGMRGGFYAERPDAQDAVRALTRYLRLEGTTIRDVFAVTRMISEESGALATQCSDPVLRAELQAFKSTIDACDTPADIVRSETALARLLALMSGNPVLRLFVEIGYTFGIRESDVHFYTSAQDRAQTRTLQHGLCEAVLAGDADIARLMMRRRSALVTEWLERETSPAT